MSDKPQRPASKRASPTPESESPTPTLTPEPVATTEPTVPRGTIDTLAARVRDLTVRANMLEARATELEAKLAAATAPAPVTEPEDKGAVPCIYVWPSAGGDPITLASSDPRELKRAWIAASNPQATTPFRLGNDVIVVFDVALISMKVELYNELFPAAPSL